MRMFAPLACIILMLACTSAGSEKTTKKYSSNPFDTAVAVEAFDPASLKESESYAPTSVDSVKVKSLAKYFRTKKDEFDPNGVVWYKPKSSPIYINANGIYLYFQKQGNVAENLRFQLQYFADDWLFFNHVQFLVDSQAYTFYPTRVETDHGDGYIWEWFDSPVLSSDWPLIKALANAKTAKMKLVGRQYHKVKTVTPAQITAMKQTLELFEAMGGRLPMNDY